MQDVEPTEDEIRAGWDKKALNDYLDERERSAAQKVFHVKRPLPTSQVPYSVFRWRK